MASVVGICNRALQKLGAKAITSITEDSVNARACNACYETLRDALLEAHPWTFATARAELAADATAPDWGRENSYQLPSDFLRLLPDYPEDSTLARDYEIEGQKIISDWSDPLYIRYTSRVTDPNVMTALFREALSTNMAFEMCEALTQSNSKKEGLRADFKAAIAEARRKNAFEKVAAQPPEDPWISVRV